MKTITSSRPEVFLRKGVLKICSKFIGKHPCRSVISVKLQSKFFEITLRRGCSPINLLHIFRTPSLKNTSGRLILNYITLYCNLVQEQELADVIESYAIQYFYRLIFLTL